MVCKAKVAFCWRSCLFRDVNHRCLLRRSAASFQAEIKALKRKSYSRCSRCGDIQRVYSRRARFLRSNPRFRLTAFNPRVLPAWSPTQNTTQHTNHRHWPFVKACEKTDSKEKKNKPNSWYARFFNPRLGEKSELNVKKMTMHSQ